MRMSHVYVSHDGIVLHVCGTMHTSKLKKCVGVQVYLSQQQHMAHNILSSFWLTGVLYT